jgi:hypothetical protein
MILRHGALSVRVLCSGTAGVDKTLAVPLVRQHASLLNQCYAVEVLVIAYEDETGLCRVIGLFPGKVFA